MISILRRAVRILLEDGVASFLAQSSNRLRKEIDGLYWRLKRTQRLSVNGTSVKFVTPDSRVAHRNEWRFNTEADQIADVLDELREDDVFYDIGANTGLYTLFAAKDSPMTNVVAFEPYPPNNELLEQNVVLNEADNVDIHRVALSNSTGKIEFDQPPVDDAGYGSATIAANSSSSFVEVPAERGDQLIQEGVIQQPTMVKIDVEGSEPVVIQGLEDALSSSACRVLYLELHLPGPENRPSVEDFDHTADALLDQLENFGFDITVVSERESELFVKGVK